MIITAEQRFELLMKISANVQWDALSADDIRLGIRESVRAGRELTDFIKNGYRVQIGQYLHETGEFEISIPDLPQPTLLELQSRFPEVVSIEKDASPTRRVLFSPHTVLASSSKRKSICGSEYENRLGAGPGTLLGYQHAAWLIEHQSELMPLRTLKAAYIDFPGVILLTTEAHRQIPFLRKSYKGWCIKLSSLDEGFTFKGRVAAAPG